jgi:hypothetical protein
MNLLVLIALIVMGPINLDKDDSRLTSKAIKQNSIDKVTESFNIINFYNEIEKYDFREKLILNQGKAKILLAIYDNQSRSLSSWVIFWVFSNGKYQKMLELDKGEASAWVKKFIKEGHEFVFFNFKSSSVTTAWNSAAIYYIYQGNLKQLELDKQSNKCGNLLPELDFEGWNNGHGYRLKKNIIEFSFFISGDGYPHTPSGNVKGKIKIVKTNSNSFLAKIIECDKEENEQYNIDDEKGLDENINYEHGKNK